MSTVQTQTAAATTYVADKAHSEATFQVRHLLSKVRGRFSDFDAKLQFNDADLEASSIQFEIQAASVDTNQPDRDTHLRSEDFFAVERFPTISFTSSRIVARRTDEFDVTGTLTMRGVSREIVLPVTFLGRAKDPWGREKLAFETETVLNRKDYGLNWNAVLETGGFLVGDDIRVHISLQTVAA